jgi:hypothetical protein
VRLSDIDSAVDRFVPLVTPIATIDEIKYEVAVFDTNENQDAWWMA